MCLFYRKAVVQGKVMATPDFGYCMECWSVAPKRVKLKSTS